MGRCSLTLCSHVHRLLQKSGGGLKKEPNKYVWVVVQEQALLSVLHPHQAAGTVAVLIRERHLSHLYRLIQQRQLQLQLQQDVTKHKVL